MLEGFGDPSLPASENFVGQAIEIDFDNGLTIAYRFHSTASLTATENREEEEESRYRAVEARPGIYYIDILAGAGTTLRNDSLVLNVDDGRATLARSRFINHDGAVRSTTDFFSGRIAGRGPINPRPRTDALVGLRIFYRYSEFEAYEHIYLNAGTFVWHCVRGGEQGLADVDRAEAYELGDDLYMLYWQESVMAVESFLIVDMKQTRSIGRMFAWDAPSLSSVHIPFDSRFTVLNRTEYPTDPK